MRASNFRFPVLTACFKVIKRNLPAHMIYVVFFLVISVLAVKLNGGNTTASFTETKTTVAYFDSDNTQFTKGLKASLAKTADFSTVKDDKTLLADALFYHSVQYIVRIPKGFTEKFLKGENVKLYKTVGQNQVNGTSIDLTIKRYLSTARLYLKGIPGLSQTALVKDVQNSVSKETPVTTKSYGSNVNLMADASSYFGYLAYVFICIIFMGISSITLSFNDDEIRKRNLVSPLRPSSMGMQLFAGQFVYAMAVFVFGLLLSLFILTTGVIGPGYFYLCLNLFCFTIVCVAISFLIGNFIKNRGAQNGIANVLSLGLAFISGIFIPQDFLSPTLLSIARFTPTFWYVKAANEIGTLSSFNFNTLSPIFTCMAIELGFAAALFALAMALIRQRKSA
jgi:ABC-2 type transport system permease protein